MAESNNAGGSERARKMRVLVVDDTAANRNMMEVFLRKLGHASLTAKDGREAIEVFERERPDIILMDLMMPEMDGFDSTRGIRARQGERWVPIIIMSALNTDQDVIAGLEAGADDYMVKPISFPVFAAKLRTMLRLLNMERSLAEALERMSTISDAVIDGIIAIDEAGVIESVNRAACEAFGYAEDELVGCPVSMLMPEIGADDGKAIERFLTIGRREGGERIRQVAGRRKSGAGFTVEIGVSDVSLVDRRLFIGVVRDVTDRERVERELADNAARLQAYHDEQQLEQELAHSIMERQIRRDWLADRRIQFSVMPARNFSGDVVIAARSPQGRFYAMLADATGHGLAAAVSVLPAITLFYDYVQRNVPLAAMVAGINDQLKNVLPVGRFVGAALLCIEESSGSGEVWVGGVPEVLLIATDGGVVSRFSSRHLPLGIDVSSPVSSHPEIFEIEPGAQVVMCSDGVLEAIDARGEAFGEARLIESLVKAEPSHRLAVVQSALWMHLEGLAAHDDMSVLIVDCVTPEHAPGLVDHCA